MLFAWRFNEGSPSPGTAKQSPIVDVNALNKRRLYAQVLAEPPSISRGYSAGAMGGGAIGGAADGDSGASDDVPSSEGFTSLLSNGDDLLRLCEHCRIVVDGVVDAPEALLAAGNIGHAALEWQKRISWFQVWTRDRLPSARDFFVPEDCKSRIVSMAPIYSRLRYIGCKTYMQNV